MLAKFKEEREKRKMAPAVAGPPGGGPASAGPRSGRGDEYRDRDRGYDRQSSRYESVCIVAPSFLIIDVWITVRDEEIVSAREVQDDGTDFRHTHGTWLYMEKLPTKASGQDRRVW